MTLQRTDRDWAMLKNEYNICRKKLDSKREGLKILVNDLDQCQIERDIYKNKVCQLQQELDELKEVVGGQWKDQKKNRSFFSCEESNDKKIKTLTQLIQHVRDENQALHNDLVTVRQLYTEAQRDNQLLRETLHQHESRKKESTSESRDKVWLIEQLEEAQKKIEDYKADVENLTDEKTDISQEREQFKEKCRRLNTQLNYVLHNDDRRLVDVDALVLENKYLKEVSKQYKEEKTIMVASVARYKEALDRRFNKANKILTYLDVPMSFSQKAFRSQNGTPSKTSSETVQELQRLTKSLTESLTDKDTALTVQRKTNRVLGTRVRELEKKLKTLEISGLWSLQGQKLDHLLPQNGTIQLQNEKEPKTTKEAKPDVELEDELASEESPTEELEFESSSWDPYCEKVQDVELRNQSVDEILIDIQSDQMNKDVNGNVSDENRSISDKSIVDTYRDDWNINMKNNQGLELEHRELRRTFSCPDTPLRSAFKGMHDIVK